MWRMLRNVFAGFLALLLISCSPAAPEPSSGTPAKTLRIALSKTIDSVPVRVAATKGQLDDPGLRVQVVERPNRDAALQALLDETADVALTCDVSMLHAVGEGERLKVLNEASISGPDTMALVALPGKGIPAKPEVLVTGDRELGRMATLTRLRTHGIPSKRVKITTGTTTDALRQLRTGKIDAAWMTEPSLSRAQREIGAEIVSDTARGALQDFPVSSYAARADAVAEDRATYSKLARLLARAQDAMSDAARVRRALPAAIGVDEGTAQLVAVGRYPTSVNSARLQRVADLMHREGIVGERIDAAQLVGPGP